ncbi:MAG: potassium transporter, partial [Arsenicicoccus sp.]
LLLGRELDLGVVRSTVFHDSAVEYVATGREVATAWFFRWLQRVAGRPKDPASDPVSRGPIPPPDAEEPGAE